MADNDSVTNGRPAHPAEDVEGIEILTQPLMTEEGFVNPACIAELESVIAKLPSAAERFSEDKEWTTRHPVSDSEICGYVAQWAVRQAKSAPPRLDDVVSFLYACFKQRTDAVWVGEFRIFNLSLVEIHKFLESTIGELDAFKAWNTSEALGDSWIDLDALIRNVCISIRNERRHDHAFNLEFEKEYGRRVPPGNSA